MSISRGVDRGAKEHSFDFQTFSVVTKELQVFLGKTIYCWTEDVCSICNQQFMTKVSRTKHLEHTQMGSFAYMLPRLNAIFDLIIKLKLDQIDMWGLNNAEPQPQCLNLSSCKAVETAHAQLHFSTRFVFVKCTYMMCLPSKAV